MSASLTFETGGEQRRITLSSSGCTIGRSAENDITLEDNRISRQHAMVQPVAGEFWISDLGSRNGTLLNGRPIQNPVALRAGDVIGIAEFTLLFDQESPVREPRGEPASGGETVLGYQRIVISVLVVDIRGFTELTQTMGESALPQMLSRFFRNAGSILANNGATAQKYMGDGFMAVWRHGRSGPNARRLLPVFDAIRQLAEMTSQLQPELGLDSPISIGAGINTGEALSANLGSDVLADHTVLGDTVNKAFRLESCTRELACSVALGEDTFALIAQGENAQIGWSAQVRLKGYQEDSTVRCLSLADLELLTAAVRKQCGQEMTVGL